jgi:hypothetical protein
LIQAQGAEVVTALLNRGANPFLKNRDGVDAMELSVVNAMKGFLWDVPCYDLLQDIRSQYFIGAFWPQMQAEWKPPPPQHMALVAIWQATTKPPPPPPPVPKGMSGPSSSGSKPPWKKAKVEAGDIMMCSEVHDFNCEIDHDVQ